MLVLTDTNKPPPVPEKLETLTGASGKMKPSPTEADGKTTGKSQQRGKNHQPELMANHWQKPAAE